MYASSPIGDSNRKSADAEILKNIPISPISHEASRNDYNLSASNLRASKSLSERLCLDQPMTEANRNSVRSTTPTNLVLSPTRSAMSNEELFIAIHKSKKRLNIKDDAENYSPTGSLNSLNVKSTQIGGRHSWSPESSRTPEVIFSST